MYLALQPIRWTLARALAASLVLVTFLAACTEGTSATDLHPEGPPMILQVRLKEVFTANDIPNLTRTVFGFGTHPEALESEEHPVTAALAVDNRMRIIVDELLRGNDLEEIQCRAVIDSDAYGPVPLGDTPDDLARCSAAQDVLPARCPGSDARSVCICTLDGGCPSALPNSVPTPKGESVGIQDIDSDGAPDATRFIQGAVVVRCGSDDVQANLDTSYYTPSGTQQKPAQGGFESLGPAVVVVPGPLPTSADCTVVFSPKVVDKDGNQVCAPANGDIAAGCTPGDTSAVHFTVEPLSFLASPPISDPGQSRTDPVRLRARAPLDPASVASITVTEGAATSYTKFTATVGTMTDANLITIMWTEGGLAAATRYTITIPTTVTDAYHHGAPQPIQFAFTTAN